MINDYYVDEYFIGEIDLVWDKKDESRFLKKERLVKSEAISLNVSTLDENTMMGKFVTIFKTCADGYFCLHDEKFYKKEDIKNLIPLSQVLPKINNKVITDLSLNSAHYLFNLLFKKGLFKGHERLYDNNPVMVEDLFITYLHFLENESEHFKYFYPNAAEWLLLRKNALFTENGESLLVKKDEDSEHEIWLNYWTYEILGLQLSEDQIYSIDSFQVYPSFDRVKDKDHYPSYYTSKIPLVDELVKKGIIIPGRELTIPEAIKLTRKIHKRK